MFTLIFLLVVDLQSLLTKILSTIWNAVILG